MDRILFLGNSLIYYNDLPQVVASLASSAGKKTEVCAITKGSATLSDFADESTEIGARGMHV